ncbi:MFS transporter [Mycolicibacterium smegmatis]|uniref:Major facilitator superfamily MFS_1 n=3 Tax=Mycolicibacterium smegmatis TaxID=1772 RepID=I7FMD3_MYCS2|nr:MFS transporter [Mycolicibacterium smegmatis]ABK72240.1 D-galactonate transporter [Mycolicibacterium smegmatis MC2 155]AFP42450.1 Major facilitator superfamily MFS_1 [Mycolicibacterium smegmatis MC2 155]AIU11172.1 glucarate transporter [Mycolicibacterium smegmatis MC2 155]AIU17796.1 glucarate transporter [Mycolicibacterium smegmatis]AIU24420.1 glucarate transporter [Mycolicibacterium smegmatis]
MTQTGNTSASPQLAKQASHARILIAVMLFITVVINYMDRANLSIAMPAIADEMDLTKAQQGLLLSAFGWTYAALQIPGGWLVDRVRPRVLYPVCLALWSLATLFMGVIGGFVALIALRLLVGVFEAPAYPINNRVATTWFPERERASVIGFYTSGQFIGLALLTPVLSWLQATMSWHWVFIVTGAIGIGWAALWYLKYREPRESNANEAELELIESGGALVDVVEDQPQRVAVTRADVATVLGRRKLWGIYLGQFCLTSTLWFFLTWFPTYLVEYRGMDYIKTGFLASLPFIAALVGVLFSGVLSDFLLRRGVSLGAARKGPIIAGLLLTTAMLGANYTDSTAMVVLFLSIAFFGNGLASITWSLVSALAPKRLLGLTGGMFNFIGNLSSIATPIIIGLLVTDESFAPGFVYMTVVTLIGIASYVLLVGRVERVREKAVTQPA